MLRRALSRLAREDSGLTLIEMLVTIIAGIVVIGALFAIQQVAMFQSNRVFARVDATQKARTTFETIESRLHSACIVEGVTPIQTGSTDTSLRFISRYGGAASLTPELHVLTYNSGSSPPTLTDAIYPKTGGVAPNWTFSSTATSTTTLLARVGAVPGTPVFQYFAYGVARDSAGNPYLDSAGNPYVMLLDGRSTMPSGVTTSGGASAGGAKPANSPTALAAAAPAGINTADAKSASEVIITLQVLAEGKLGADAHYNSGTVGNESATFSDAVTLRLTPPPADRNPQAVAPCA